MGDIHDIADELISTPIGVNTSYEVRSAQLAMTNAAIKAEQTEKLSEVLAMLGLEEQT